MDPAALVHLASFLPDEPGPYAALMVIGFIVAIFGHMSRLWFLIAAGILMIMIAAVAFPFAIDAFSDQTAPPTFLP